VYTHSEIANLLRKHLTNELTLEESAALQDWIEQSAENRAFFNEVSHTPVKRKVYMIDRPTGNKGQFYLIEVD